MPLGKDCLKYLTKTPKAPLGIDQWMEEDVSPSNSTMAVLRRAGRDLPEPQSVDTTAPRSISSTDILTRFLWVWLGIGVCMFLVVIYPYRKYTIVICPRKTIAFSFKGLTLMGAIGVGNCTYVLYTNLFRQRSQWNAAHEFLASCELLSVSRRSDVGKEQKESRLEVFNIVREEWPNMDIGERSHYRQ